jgi:hypothetical protein
MKIHAPSPFLQLVKSRVCLLCSSIQDLPVYNRAMQKNDFSTMEQASQFQVNRTKLLPVSCWHPNKTPAVLLACGSYSPPTIMHTRIFEAARDHFEVVSNNSNIQIIGGFVSPVHDRYGKKDLAPAHHRMEMVNLGGGMHIFRHFPAFYTVVEICRICCQVLTGQMLAR